MCRKHNMYKILQLVSLFTYVVCAPKYSYKVNKFQVPLDHFGFQRTETFSIKYLENDDNWDRGNGPIFFYTGNEGQIEVFANHTGFMWEIANQFKAKIVFAEHRYYGESMPFKENSLKNENIGYLTSAQAMADYAELINYLQENRIKPRYPVIAFGGSYGGMLAAYMRLKYPHIVNGAIAASAPVHMFTGMTNCNIFNRLATSSFKNVNKNCSSNIRDSWNVIRNYSSNANGSEWLHTNWKLCSPVKNSTDLDTLLDFLNSMYTTLAMVNYPYASDFLMPLPAEPVRYVCQYLEKTLTGEDLLKAIGKVLDVYSNYDKKSKCVDYKQGDNYGNLDAAGWDYQACTEMVMPMCSNGKTDMFEPMPWNYTLFAEACHKKYNVYPRPEMARIEYGGDRLQAASNIVFSNGMKDPWTGGGILDSLSDTIYAEVIPDAAHHLDLMPSNPNDPEPVKMTREMHKEHITRWINQFQEQQSTIRHPHSQMVNVIHLTLHHLNMQSYGISNHGYFHYKTHICAFIDRHWQSLFGSQAKQKKNWVGTIAGALSVYNKLFFKSGSVVLGETGWWKLLHNFSPAVAAHIIQEIARDKPKVRPRNQMSIDRNLFLMKVTEMGYKDLINNEGSPPRALPSPSEPVPCKKRRVDSDELSGISSTSYYDQLDSDSRNEIGDESTFEESLGLLTSKDCSYSWTSPVDFRGFEYMPTHHVPPVQSDSSSIHSFQQSMLYYDSDSRSGHETDQEPRKTFEPKPKKQPPEETPIRRESLFSFEPNSEGLPWEDPVPKPDSSIVLMSQYEEIQLLKKVENLIPKVKEPNKKAYLHRLKAKLALRRLKRHKHLPLFDVDKEVKILGGYVTEDPRVVINSERVLDRFQRSYLIDNLSGTIASSNYGTLLLSHIEPTTFRSTYSGVTLKPYIRRDAESKPTWLKLTDELLRKANRHIKDYSPPPQATLDYSYVRPQHIAAVNNLCAQFFWPGIDVSESLQYPEFSCVVTYKKLVVGCAFLVPGVRLGEAYISFILTRPEWRNAKIATFMLYHLLQTCSGQDVTLHVSPTNPAIFLYQKFGFKVEELIQDFFEKYYDIDYKGCRHALFLRLVR